MRGLLITGSRRRKIVAVALDMLQCYWHESLHLFETGDSLVANPVRLEIDVDGKRMFAPTDSEMEDITSPGRNGNWRTKELVTMALLFLRDDDRFVDDKPSDDEIEAVLRDIDLAVNTLPPVHPTGVPWRVYEMAEDGCQELVDTVYFAANCDHQYVKSCLDNDGYNAFLCVS